jgi:LytR cell envelope-related transcriptional attenuator
MTTPDPSPPVPTRADTSDGRAPERRHGPWTAVARLLSLQLLTVIAVTAVITGIYALAGGHSRDQQAVGSATTAPTARVATTSAPAASTPPASTPPASPTASPPASPTPSGTPTVSPPPPAAASRLKVDVLNQSGPGGVAAKTASRVRSLGWTVGRVADFRGNVSTTTVYYPAGEAKAAHDLAGALPGKPRVLLRFSTLASKRLTVIITR